MRKFIIKGLLFLIILGAILYGIELPVPYYWGDPQLVEKMTYYKKPENKFDTLFLGSSHVYRHIIPSLFDNLTEVKTRSFNFGIGGMGSLESYAFYENLLRKDILPQTKYVFMELAPIQRIPKQYLHSEKVKYFLTYHYYNLAVNYFKADDDKNREAIIENYTIAYRQNIFKIALFKKMLMFILSPSKAVDKLPGRHSDGFYSNEEEYAVKISECEKCRITPEEINANLKAAKAAYQQNKLPEPNKIYLQNINRLIEESRDKSIQLIFFLSPTGNYEQMLPILNQIDDQHKIDMANPLESAELYSMDVYFDRGHYNDKGAKLFTEKLAQKFNRLLKR